MASNASAHDGIERIGARWHRTYRRTTASNASAHDGIEHANASAHDGIERIGARRLPAWGRIEHGEHATQYAREIHH
jgi:hypothetical protein